ncbi:EpsG family protein [Lachnospiraceae bacterium XPB1003]|nr:EpsG family protein [Lachnospiraceae bacterium XPB1003]
MGKNMIWDLLPYYSCFVASVIMIAFVQRIYNDFKCASSLKYNVVNWAGYSILVFFALFPVISMFGLRYGIGVDYYNYELIYNTLHGAPFSEYWKYFLKNEGVYYVEPGYYILNQFFSNYRFLLWGIGILVFELVCWSIKDYSKKLSFGLAIFAFLSIQYSHFLTAMRFTIAMSFILIAYKYLAENKTKHFFLFMFFSSLFHKTALVCFSFYLLKNFKSKKLNRVRNWMFVIFLISFPLISGFLFSVVSRLAVFERYFTTARYSISSTMNVSYSIIFHTLFAIGPILIFAKDEIFDSDNTSILFRVCMMELPFRVLGFYNSWITRISRLPQVAQVLFIPLVLAKVKNTQKRVLLYIYYIIWFAFNFAYYELVNNICTSLPYTSVFSKH